MKPGLRIIIVFLSLFFLNCSEKTTEPTGDFKVSGVVYQKNEVVPNTPLQLKKNDDVVQETTSDEKGYFEFRNVAEAKYTLVTKQTFDNGSFLESPTEINVNGDLYLESLILPKPVTLLNPISFTTKTIKLHWSPYTGNGFYEYKVYRHNSTALDETTGTLIHIATEPTDTTFIDGEQEGGLFPNTTFYYRVYINNEYGRMGGSNILETKTAEWDNEENFTAFYNLEYNKSFSTPKGKILGLDSDGENLWVLIVESIGGYYSKNIVKIFKYDYENDTPLDTLIYTDEYIFPRSLMYADGFLWIYYDDVMGPWIYKISPETGEIVESFSSYTLEDMAAYNNFYQTRVDTEGDIIRKINLSDFSIAETFRFHPYDGLIDGIAARENELWITARFTNKIIILNKNGNHIGVVESDNSNGGPAYKLCFIGEKLAYSDGTRIYIVDINGAP